MQRSRKALLTRRALWKTNRTNFFYKASLPPVVFMWGLLFLLYIRIGHDDGYRDGLIDLPKDSYTYQTEAKSGTIQNHAFINKTQQIHFSFSNEELKETKTERFLVQDLDEFKNKAFGGAKIHPSNPNPENIIHRLEPSGAKYNYASSSKGAKVLAHNKEAKGAPNILNTDQNQYLRNPCSSEDKFVILELSEETLIDTIEIANFEHYSSNLKGFEVFGSSVYPTESWVKLGVYTAVNVKNSQRFVLRDPKWMRYVKLNLQSHYGTGFYCTLSDVRVYGVDAVEMMLEDLVFARNNEFLSNEHEGDGKPEPEGEPWLEERANVPDPHVGRLPGDSVLRLLMQKVRLLDINLEVLERFLDELNSRYGYFFKEIDAEIGERDVVVEKVRKDLRDLHESKDVVKEHVEELESWKSLVSIQVDIMTMDNAFLRSEVAKLRVNQERMEDTGVVIFLVSLTFGLFAIANLFLNKLLFIYYRDDRSQKTIVEFG
ncbi:hypothetical protein Lser_V15G23148 [Lactuca serriola]